jgi:hypothetical protein
VPRVTFWAWAAGRIPTLHSTAREGKRKRIRRLFT